MALFYSASLFSIAFCYFLTALLLFLRRKDGERSRLLLSGIILISVWGYGSRFVCLLMGITPHPIESNEMLLWALALVTCYIMYPIEVISPGWLTFKHTLRLFSPLLILTLLQGLLSVWEMYPALSCGTECSSVIAHIQKGLHVLLFIMLFLPLGFIFLIPYTKRYNNTDRRWIRNYSIAFLINNIAYIIILLSETIVLHAIYYYISIGCSLYIVYQELFTRLIKPSDTLEVQQEEESTPHPCERIPMEETEKSFNLKSEKLAELFARLEAYMEHEHAWQDPDLSITVLARHLCTNRTSLGMAIRQQGYENYTAYINQLRIKEFIDMVRSHKATDLQEVFFLVGFRSKSTALRNFRNVTGTTPSEYFHNLLLQEEA